MNKHLKDVQSQLKLIHEMTQDTENWSNQNEVDKDELMLRSLIALSCLESYFEEENK